MDGRLRRWVKLLLNLLVADGRGDPTTELSVPAGGGPPRSDAGIPTVNDGRFRVCVSVLGPEARLKECGDEGTSWSCNLGTGDPERDPCLKGELWKETDGRLLGTSPAFNDNRRLGAMMGSECGGTSTLAGREPGGELVSEPGALTALRAEMGLVPRGPSPWNVDKLPYRC
jgi:hypothetical protein